MSRIIIGLAGQIGSGKDSIADYVKEKYGGVVVSFSDPLRDILRRLHLPIDRSHLADLTQSLVDKFGVDVLSKTISAEIEKSDKKIFVLPNIRRPGDLKHISSIKNFYLVGIKTDPRICYERLIKRGQNEDDKTKTWEDFQKDLKRSTEVEIDDLINVATYRLDNNGTVESLRQQVDELISKLSQIP